MKPLKIIDIERTALHKPADYDPVESDNFYLSSWGGLFAKRLVSKYPYLDIEVWKAEPGFKEIYERKAHGVSCRVFPYRFHLFSVITLSMLITLYQLSRKHHLVLYRSLIWDWKFVLLSSILLPKADIILSHHGGRTPDNSSLKNRINRRLMELSYTKVKVVTYLRKEIKEWIESVSPLTKLVLLPVGADFSLYTPLDKQLCRLELGLDTRKIYAVYVGKFYRLKGVDIILDLLRDFKDQNFEVLFAGGREGNELMDEVKSSGCRYWGYVGGEILHKIYCAADFYIHPAFHPQFGGLDVTLMEALACATPALSPQLLEYDFDSSELGIAVTKQDEFREKFVEMLSRYRSFNNCREVAQRHLDGKNAIIDKLYNALISTHKDN